MLLKYKNVGKKKWTKVQRENLKVCTQPCVQTIIIPYISGKMVCLIKACQTVSTHGGEGGVGWGGGGGGGLICVWAVIVYIFL